MKRGLALAIPPIALMAVGWVDYITGPLLAFSPFYLLVIAYVARQVSRPVALTYAVFAAVVFLVADLLTIPALASTIYPYWRAVATLIGFALVAYIIPSLVEERQRLASSEVALIRQRAELQELNHRLIVTLEELSAAKDRALGDLVAEHTAAVRGLHEELERGLSLFRAVRGESARLPGNGRSMDHPEPSMTEGAFQTPNQRRKADATDTLRK